MRDAGVGDSTVNDDHLEGERQADDAAPLMGKQIRVRLVPDLDVEPQIVNEIIVNFTGDHFIVAFARAFPPTFRVPDDLPDEIESKVLFRAVITTRKWAEAVKSIADQLARLQAAGTLPELTGESEAGE